MMTTIRSFFSGFQIKRFILLFLIPSLVLTGCTGGKETDSAKNSIRIGVCMLDSYLTFGAEIASYMSDYCKMVSSRTGTSIQIDMVSAGSSQYTQNNQAEKFIDKGYDVLCVNLVDRTDAYTIIDKAKAADIPIVFYNNEPVEEDMNRYDKAYYVGTKGEQAGRMQASIVTVALSDEKRFKEVDKNGDETIQYVVLEGAVNHQDAFVRNQVSVEEIMNAGFSVEKLGDEIANWDRSQAKTKMQNLIGRYSYNIEMVIAADDDMALGALDAFKEDGLELPLIVGCDGTRNVFDAIKNRQIEGTAYQDAIKHAKTIVDMAYALAVGGDIPADIDITDERYVYIPFQIIRQSNVQTYSNLSIE